MDQIHKEERRILYVDDEQSSLEFGNFHGQDIVV